MGRKRKNNVYTYFTLEKEIRQSTCLLCKKILHTIHGTNLVKHLQSNHKTEYNEVLERNMKDYKHSSWSGCETYEIGQQNKSVGSKITPKKQIVYEYVLAPPSPSSSNGNESSYRDEDIKPKISRSSRSLSVESSSSDTQMNLQANPERQQTQKVKAKKKNIIKELTEQKLTIASMQMEVLEKEKQERTIKISMLNEEREHRKQMRQFEKQEIMLRIKSLKANLVKPMTVPGAVLPFKIID